MSEELTTKWDARYRAAEGEVTACYALREFAHLLPNEGEALDLACGRGGNALLLAEQGLQTQAWDLSSVAVEHLQSLADARGLAIRASVRDVEQAPPPANSFDVIVVSYYLDRGLAPALMNALKPNGLLFYETFIREKPPGLGPSNPDYLLRENELLRLFNRLHLLAYREEGLVGTMGKGQRSVAMLVAQRRI
ncbi:class I SAM-dependent methyltransferase [Sulfuriflexus mobilis]|uniref:class I SAM-dependent methyltransferase n=1 Tax=Sulfuriflexus mobilis TaxID=1811807 RepID=UPI000F8422E0|nr:class I SAM-dependent methyltransferase [Sulfuriflexus mobilis]